MLEIRNITKRFGGVTALNSCSFKVREKEITALVGPNGAGKTTIFDAISGLIPVDEGMIILGEQDITSMRPDKVAGLGINRTWQQVRLFKNLSIFDHLCIAESNNDHKLLRNLFTGLRLRIMRRKHDDSSYELWLKKFGIKRPVDTVVADLSYGQRKLLALAMAVIRPHKILLLDEPVAGVNQVIQSKMEELLVDLKNKGETILVIEHDMEFVKRLADRVVVMDAGKVLMEGKPEVALSDKKVIEAYLGE